MDFLIDPEVIHQNSYLPDRLAELSLLNEQAALDLLRDYGFGRKPVKQLWKEVTTLIAEHKGVAL